MDPPDEGTLIGDHDGADHSRIRARLSTRGARRRPRCLDGKDAGIFLDCREASGLGPHQISSSGRIVQRSAGTGHLISARPVPTLRDYLIR